MSLQSNNAVMLLGASNDKKTAVASSLAAMNIDLLRLEPSNVETVVTPFSPQPNYYGYTLLLPAYLAAMDGHIDISSTGYPIEFDINEVLPFPQVLEDIRKVKESKEILTPFAQQGRGKTSDFNRDRFFIGEGACSVLESLRKYSNVLESSDKAQSSKRKREGDDDESKGSKRRNVAFDF